MRRPSMKSFTSLTQTDLAACRCAEPALTRDRAFARIGTLQLTKKNHNSQAAREISISPSVLKTCHPRAVFQLQKNHSRNFRLMLKVGERWAEEAATFIRLPCACRQCASSCPQLGPGSVGAALEWPHLRRGAARARSHLPRTSPVGYSSSTRNYTQLRQSKSFFRSLEPRHCRGKSQRGMSDAITHILAQAILAQVVGTSVAPTPWKDGCSGQAGLAGRAGRRPPRP